MTLIEVDHGVRLDVCDLGDGPAVVLISGFGLDHELWDRQVGTLTAAGRRVLRVSQRGHGLSDRPLGGYEIDRLASDLLTALDTVGVSEATVVGHSFGGQVAFRAAARAPELITRLVLVGSNGVRASRGEGYPFGAPPEAVLDGVIGAERENRITSRYRTLRSAFGSEPDERVVDWLARSSLRMPSWAAIACLRSMLTTDLQADLPVVSQPVLQIVGLLDPVLSLKGARWLTEQLRDATLVEMACGHYPMLEAADAFEAALLEFLPEPARA